MVAVNGKPVKVERYTVEGLIWGMETLWMDGSNNLAALVSTDAEFDHFEAVRDEYEPALSSFVASAAHDEMAALTEMSTALPGRRTGTFAFVGATVIDVTGKPPIPNATVVTSGGKIVAVGSSSSVKIPKDAQRIDVSGKFIIPGLWDMHAHYEQVEWGPIYLAAGVTTVRDVGNEYDFITQVRDAVNSGKALGPHMLLAGIVDGDSPYAIGVTRVNNADDAQKWVTKYHDANFQQIKIYSSVKSDNVKAICADAHKFGMTVTGHIPNGMDAYEGGERWHGHDQPHPLHCRPADAEGCRPALRLKGPERLEGDGLDRYQLGGRQEGGRVLRRASNRHRSHRFALRSCSFRPASEPAEKDRTGHRARGSRTAGSADQRRPARQLAPLGPENLPGRSGDHRSLAQSRRTYRGRHRSERSGLLGLSRDGALQRSWLHADGSAPPSGLPRRLNRLADLALLIAYAQELVTVDVSVVSIAAREFKRDLAA